MPKEVWNDWTDGERLALELRWSKPTDVSPGLAIYKGYGDEFHTLANDGDVTELDRLISSLKRARKAVLSGRDSADHPEFLGPEDSVTLKGADGTVQQVFTPALVPFNVGALVEATREIRVGVPGWVRGEKIAKGERLVVERGYGGLLEFSGKSGSYSASEFKRVDPADWAALPVEVGDEFTGDAEWYLEGAPAAAKVRDKNGVVWVRGRRWGNWVMDASRQVELSSASIASQTPITVVHVPGQEVSSSVSEAEFVRGQAVTFTSTNWNLEGPGVKYRYPTRNEVFYVGEVDAAGKKLKVQGSDQWLPFNYVTQANFRLEDFDLLNIYGVVAAYENKSHDQLGDGSKLSLNQKAAAQRVLDLVQKSQELKAASTSPPPLVWRKGQIAQAVRSAVSMGGQVIDEGTTVVVSAVSGDTMSFKETDGIFKAEDFRPSAP